MGTPSLGNPRVTERQGLNLPADTPTYVTALFKRIGELERAHRESANGHLARRVAQLEQKLGKLSESHGTMGEYIRQELAEIREAPLSEVRIEGPTISISKLRESWDPCAAAVEAARAMSNAKLDQLLLEQPLVDSLELNPSPVTPEDIAALKKAWPRAAYLERSAQEQVARDLRNSKAARAFAGTVELADHKPTTVRWWHRLNPFR